MLNKNQIKELEMITLLNKKFNSGDIISYHWFLLGNNHAT